MSGDKLAQLTELRQIARQINNLKKESYIQAVLVFAGGWLIREPFHGKVFRRFQDAKQELECLLELAQLEAINSYVKQFAEMYIQPRASLNRLLDLMYWSHGDEMAEAFLDYDYDELLTWHSNNTDSLESAVILAEGIIDGGIEIFASNIYYTTASSGLFTFQGHFHELPILVCRLFVAHWLREVLKPKDRGEFPGYDTYESEFMWEYKHASHRGLTSLMN